MAVGSSPSAAGAGAVRRPAGRAGTRTSPRSRRPKRETSCWPGATRPTSVQRAAFQALRKGILLSYYCLPWQGEGPNPVDEALGYPGPLGPPENPPPKTIEPLDDHGGHRARLRRRGRRLGRRRRHRGRGAGRGRARRGRGRGGRLLQRGGLRRRRAVRLRAALPQRRRRGHRRPEHRAAGRLVPRRRDGRQLHLVLPAARLRARGLEAALRARPTGPARTSTTASTRSGSGSRSAPRAASRLRATTRCAPGWTSSAGTRR